MKYLNISFVAPVLLGLYFVIAFYNWDYETGTRKEDASIYPVSSFSMFNRAPDIKYRAVLKKLQETKKYE
jgi:hypothetical protein